MLYPNGIKTRPTVSSPYGPRKGGVSSFHEGADLIGFADARSAGGGVVTFAGWLNDAAGYTVTIRHDGYVTRYMHLDSIAVRKGQTVGEGHYLGRVGDTGNATGKCLHFEVRVDGTGRVEPLGFVAARLTGAPANVPAAPAPVATTPQQEEGEMNPFVAILPNGRWALVLPQGNGKPRAVTLQGNAGANAVAKYGQPIPFDEAVGRDSLALAVDGV